jgi:hypothetical protein
MMLMNFQNFSFIFKVDCTLNHLSYTKPTDESLKQGRNVLVYLTHPTLILCVQGFSVRVGHADREYVFGFNKSHIISQLNDSLEQGRNRL